MANASPLRSIATFGMNVPIRLPLLPICSADVQPLPAI
jgi:hypothetical protein